MKAVAPSFGCREQLDVVFGGTLFIRVGPV